MGRKQQRVVVRTMLKELRVPCCGLWRKRLPCQLGSVGQPSVADRRRQNFQTGHRRFVGNHLDHRARCALETRPHRRVTKPDPVNGARQAIRLQRPTDVNGIRHRVQGRRRMELAGKIELRLNG